MKALILRSVDPLVAIPQHPLAGAVGTDAQMDALVAGLNAALAANHSTAGEISEISGEELKFDAVFIAGEAVEAGEELDIVSGVFQKHA